jgi:hypothetical protein
MSSINLCYLQKLILMQFLKVKSCLVILKGIFFILINMQQVKAVNNDIKGGY